jgi:ATP-dependent exoDNAse (exonuclease V) alpha subunit
MMAIFRFEMKLVKRSVGRSVVAAAAYRAGARLTDIRTGATADYTRRQGVVHTGILAPPGAPKWTQDRTRLWNAVEAAERRKDAQLAREAVLALPHELDLKAQIALVEDFVRSAFVARGMVADVAIHRPVPPADPRNVHAHILIGLRRPTMQGFGPKVREWNDRALLMEWRHEWARSVNQSLRDAGISLQVDHRARRDIVAGRDGPRSTAYADYLRRRRRASREAALVRRLRNRQLKRLRRLAGRFHEQTLEELIGVEEVSLERTL